MGKLQEFTIETKLVPSPATYSILLPDNYETTNESYPMMLILHGGGGNNKFLDRITPMIQQEWDNNTLPEMIFVTPSCNRSFYMDYRDGSEMWESFILKELLPTIRKNYRISDHLNKNIIGGVSMGGMGSLRMGLKNLDLFGCIISIEPGIEPVFEFKDIKIEDRFYRDQTLFEKIFGNPIDESYWQINNPSYIAQKNADKIRASGIKIYISVGTDDMFGLFRGSEFIHRILFDNDIKHEYKLIYKADHVGKTTAKLMAEGMEFLNRILTPSEPDPVLEMASKRVNQMKKNAGILDLKKN